MSPKLRHGIDEREVQIRLLPAPLVREIEPTKSDTGRNQVDVRKPRSADELAWVSLRRRIEECFEAGLR